MDKGIYDTSMSDHWILDVEVIPPAEYGAMQYKPIHTPDFSSGVDSFPVWSLGVVGRDEGYPPFGQISEWLRDVIKEGEPGAEKLQDGWEYGPTYWKISSPALQKKLDYLEALGYDPASQDTDIWYKWTLTRARGDEPC